MIICVTGFPGAGKTSVGKVLEGIGFKTYELGDLIREMMKKRHIPLTPESDRKFTIEMREKHGKLVMVKYLLDRIRMDKKDRIAIVGIRSKPELDYIRKRARVTTIAVVAPARLRYERTARRKRADAPKSFGEFIRNRDRKEESFGLLGAIKSADYVIAGTGTLADLNKNVKKIVELIGE